MTIWLIKPDDNDPKAAYFEGMPGNGPAAWKYNDGISLVKEFPTRAEVRFSTNYPDGRILTDVLDNVDGVFCVSSKAKEIIEKHVEQAKVEFLPVAVLDHEGNPSASFFFVNPLDNIDCVNLDESDVNFSAIDNSQISSVDNLILDLDRIPEERPIFRLANMTAQILFTDAMREAWETAGLQGLTFWDSHEWDGMFI